MPVLNLISQLRFTRSEFERSFVGVSDAESKKRFLPINSIGWMVGHLAWHEQHYWLKRAQGLIPFPQLDEETAFGKPAADVALTDMIKLWRAVTGQADIYLDQLTGNMLETCLVVNGKPLAANIGTMLNRMIYHYWYHIGEMQAVRQLLGQKDLPSFVGNTIETEGKFYLDD